MQFDDWLSGRLLQTRQAGLYRTLRTMQGAPQTEVFIDGEEQIVCSSNNYLGLAADGRLIDAAQSALTTFGLGSSGSRLTTGNTEWHEKLEKKLAHFKQTQAALLFSSGYLANIGVLSSLPEKGDVILSDRFNHASIIDGCRLSKAKTVIYEHINMRDLESRLQETQRHARRFIVTDGVFSMDGTIAPLPELMHLAKRYHAYVIVDDAHATGVLGKHGRGTSEHFGVHPDVVIGTLSKAVGTEGGFAAGSHVLIDFLRNHARTFIFQTAMAPASCAASFAALEIIEQSEEKRIRLSTYITKIKTGLTEMGYFVKGDFTPIIPVMIGQAEQAVLFSEKLQEQGVYAPAIRPPTVPEGESRIRLTVTADHTEKEIQHILASFKLIGKEMKII